jgi:DNA mismatch repair protein MLH1
LNNSFTTDLNESVNNGSATGVKLYPYQMTRMDSKERKLDTYFVSSPSNNNNSPIVVSRINTKKSQNDSLNESSISLSSLANSSRVFKNSYDKETNRFNSTLRNYNIDDENYRNINFKSLSELRNHVEKNASKTIHQILQNMNYVGCVNRELSLIQFQTELYLTNTRKLSEELFYQIALFNFGNFGYYKFKEPILLHELAMMALDNPQSEWSPDDGSKEKLSSRCAKFLFSKSRLLDDYFSIRIVNIDNAIYLESIPILLDNYEPDLIELPLFIIRLATDVNWKDEKECFDSICRQLGLFYSTKNNQVLTEEDDSDIADESNATLDSDLNSQSSQNETKNTKKSNDEWIIEHVVYTAFRNMLLVTNEYEKEAFFKLVDLSRLYRVFERC